MPTLMPPIKNVAIIGLGLIGGSIGLKLKATHNHLRIIGVPRREETITQALKMGAIDEGNTNLTEGVKEADLIFICAPLNLILPAVKTIAPYLKVGAIVTDVGSAKAAIVRRAEKVLGKKAAFVGGHPMAGKEKVKLAAAEAELFQEKIWVLTPTAETNKAAVKSLSKIIASLGSNILILSPEKHDLAVAGISHLPLAVAASLVNTIANVKQGKEEMKKCAASGFRDTTRIASGDPQLGVDMFTTNKTAMLKLLSAFKKALSRIEKSIKEGEQKAIERELQKAKLFRDSLFN